MTVAYDDDILARPEFERVHVSQYGSQAFQMAASEQLEAAFEVVGDRHTVRDEDHINLLNYKCRSMTTTRAWMRNTISICNFTRDDA